MNPERQAQQAMTLIDQLAYMGVTQAVISPGARSTLLVLACEYHNDIVCHHVLDERTAGFFALGQARIANVPSMLICTSGSALGHYLPAVLEADAAAVPVIVITADRPWELQGAGANQTLSQQGIFSSHINAAFEIGEAHEDVSMAQVSKIAARAYRHSVRPLPGPVHVNMRFRKPLHPTATDVYTHFVTQPPIQVTEATGVSGESGGAELAQRLKNIENGLIVCGPSLGDTTQLSDAVNFVSTRMGYPVYAETGSAVQVNNGLHAPLMEHLHSVEGFPVPEVVIQLGRAPVSAWFQQLATDKAVSRVIVTPHLLDDPFAARADFIVGPVSHVLQAAAEHCDGVGPGGSLYAQQVLRSNAAASTALVQQSDAIGFVEASLVQSVVSCVQAPAVLVVGNSLTIRDFNRYSCGVRSRVLHQRGLSGIDGMVSGALGVASISDAPVVLVTGDLSLVHDIGALIQLRALKLNLTIVVVNNNGGRIFEQLPIGKLADGDSWLDDAFVMSDMSQLDFISHIGIGYYRVTEIDAFTQALSGAMAQQETVVIDAAVINQERAQWQSRIDSAVADAILETL